MGDFNDDITTPPISNFFASLGMHSILLSLFQHKFAQAPQTYYRGHSTIDGIFATPSIQAVRGGYLTPYLLESDHRPIWIDLSISSIFNSNSAPQTPLHCRKLKNEDPRTVLNFNQRYHKLLAQHNLHTALHNLLSSITTSLSPIQQKEYERIDKIRVQCLLLAESKCRCLKTGNLEYSPTLQKQKDLFRFWKLILNGNKVIGLTPNTYRVGNENSIWRTPLTPLSSKLKPT